MADSADVNFSVWEASASLERCIEVILHIELKVKPERELRWKFGVSNCSTCKVILKFSSVTQLLLCPCWKQTIYRRFVHTLSRNEMFWWLISEKIASCLQHSETKYRYFIWAKRKTALRAAMVYSACSIALVLASFNVTLPSERENPSWIDCTIEISSSTNCWSWW